jgi:hypothetical protein
MPPRAAPPSTQTDERHPPNWLVTAALASLPVTIGAAAAFGSIDARWAIASLFIGLTVFFFIIGLWCVPVRLRWMAVALGTATLGAAVLVVGLLSLSLLSDQLSPSEPTTPVTTTSTLPRSTATGSTIAPAVTATT